MSGRILNIDKEYEFVRKIAGTSKSSIWLARSLFSKFFCVIKELFISQIVCPSHVWNERECMEMLGDFPKCPHIIGTSKNEESIFIVMDLVYGIPLHELPRPIHPNTIQNIFAQCVSIIEYIHSKKILFRDIKLSNFLLDGNYVYICDFGLSKKINQRTNSVCGTLHAMAPEIMHEPVSYGFEVDFWALGVLLYELIEGIPPFGWKPTGYNAPLCFTNSDPTQMDLLKKLLDPNPGTRLTNFDQIKAHPYWVHIDEKSPPTTHTRDAIEFIHGQQNLMPGTQDQDPFKDF